ncbi:MAG: GNAT family N-acetyltransferase [Thermomicrobiales bacterium]
MTTPDRQVQVPIETKRLILRFNVEEDLDDVFAFHGRDDATRWIDFDTRTREEVRELLDRRQKNRRIEKDDDRLTFAVVERESNRVIGDIYFFVRSLESKQAEIGFIFNPDFHGRGYATEACEAVLALAFETYDLHRVYAECDVLNPPAFKLMERLGMRREAQFLENLWLKGQWSDSYVYAILAREWKALK